MTKNCENWNNYLKLAFDVCIVQNNFEESVIIILKTEEVSKNNTSASMFGGNSGGSGFTFGTQTPSTQGGWFIFKLARNFLIATICLWLLSFSKNPLSCSCQAQFHLAYRKCTTAAKQLILLAKLNMANMVFT